MNEREPMTAEAERASRLVRSLRTPEADPEFRTRLREAFVSGRIEAPARVAPPPVTSSGGRPWWRLPVARWALAAAAFVVVWMAGSALNRAPAWQVLEVHGVGVATVDGRPVMLDKVEQLTALIRPGARVRVPDGATVALASRGQMALELTADADVVIPSAPGRWFGRSTYAEVNRGIMRITTGHGFRGARLHVETPAADVDVTGTTLAVICEPVGTCVCVLEGGVKVGRQGEEMIEVAAGRRRFVFLDGTDEQDTMRESEAVSLTALRDARRDVLER